MLDANLWSKHMTYKLHITLSEHSELSSDSTDSTDCTVKSNLCRNRNMGSLAAWSHVRWVLAGHHARHDTSFGLRKLFQRYSKRQIPNQILL
jgi:hypothetical protein